MRLVLAAALLCVWISLVQCNRLKPPLITQPNGNKWNGSIIKRPYEAETIKCFATGNPRPTYEWTRNGEHVFRVPYEIMFDSVTGDLTFGSQFPSKMNGYYQCKSSNSEGTSMTPLLYIAKAVAETFRSDGGGNENVEAYTTAYKKLQCSGIPNSIPAHKFKWKRKNTGSPVNGVEHLATQVEENERLVIDTKGNLHILWVEEDDAQVYTCGYHNSVVNTDMWSVKTTTLNVLKSAPIVRYPSLEFTEPDLKVMAGSKAVLSCIFSYYSSGDGMKVIWERGSKILKEGNDFSFVIDVTQISDQDNYICTGIVGDKQVSSTVTLNVTSPPLFVKNKSPAPISVEKNTDAVFYCETTSHDAHASAPSWFKNGKPIVGCPPMTWECVEKMGDGSPQCIPMSARCNRFPDCGFSDASDEKDCPVSCRKGFVDCNGKCIPSNQECTEVCYFPDFLCANTELRLPSAMVCNPSSNCSDLSDEVGCPNRSDFDVNGYQFTSDRTIMTIPNLKLGDNQCIQCSVTNEYGTVFGDGCLTVIDRISILSGPNITYNVSPGMFLNLSINAVTDSMYATQLKYEWFYHPKPAEEDRQRRQATQLAPILLPSNSSVLDISKYFILKNDNKTITIHVPDVDEESDSEEYDAYMAIAGEGQKYSVVISHKFDRVERNFTIIGEKVAPPDRISILSGPNITYNVSPGMFLNLSIIVETDSMYATQLKYEWFYHPKPAEEDRQRRQATQLAPILLPSNSSVLDISKYFILKNDNKTITIHVPDVDEESDSEQYDAYMAIAGEGQKYSVVISHKFDRVERNFTIIGEKVAPPDRISILSGPNITYNVSPGMFLNLSIIVETDSMYATQLKYEWFYHPKPAEEDRQRRQATQLAPILLPSNSSVLDISKYFILKNDNKTITIHVPDVDEESDSEQYDAYMAIAGEGQKYSVVISHKFDRVERNFTIIGEKVAPPDRISILSGPNITYNVSPGMFLNLSIIVETDSMYATQLKYEWFYHPKPAEEDRQRRQATQLAPILLPSNSSVLDISKYFILKNDNKTITIHVPDVDEESDSEQYDAYMAIAGEGQKYSVVISHKFDRVERNFTIIGEKVAPPDRISILSGPNITYNVSPGMFLNLSIIVETDSMYATQLKYEWFYHPKPAEEDRQRRQATQLAPILLPSNSSVLDISKYFILKNDNKTITIHVPDVDEESDSEQYDAYMAIAGEGQKYSVVISHKFDRVERNFTIIGEKVAPPDRISILSGPNITYNVSPGMFLNLSIIVETDSMYATQLKYEWFYHPKPAEEDRQRRQATQLAPILLPSNSSVLDISKYFILKNDNKTITIHVPDVDEESDSEQYDAYMAIAGEGQKYSVVISHTFDRVERNFTIIGEKVAPPVVPVVSTASSNLWLILVILGVVLLIVTIIIVVCLLKRRDPKGAYYVDKKDHEADNNPEQELKDSGFPCNSG